MHFAPKSERDLPAEAWPVYLLLPYANISSTKGIWRLVRQVNKCGKSFLNGVSVRAKELSEKVVQAWLHCLPVKPDNNSIVRFMFCLRIHRSVVMSRLFKQWVVLQLLVSVACSTKIQRAPASSERIGATPTHSKERTAVAEILINKITSLRIAHYFCYAQHPNITF